MAISVLTAATAGLMVPSYADAHTRVVEANPTAGQVFGGVADHFEMRFPVDVSEAIVTLTDPNGSRVEATLEADAGSTLALDTAPLTVEGQYVMEWSATTPDGDRQAAAYGFTYDADAPPIAIHDETGGTARWIAVAAILAVLGIAAVVVLRRSSG